MAKKLLDQLREALRLKHYSYRTEEAYINWVRRFVLFHHKRHPTEMGAAEIRAFLAHLAQERHVSASTQNQALSAILFLYREVLHKEIEPILLTTAKRPERLPTVLTPDEVLRLINQLNGIHKLMAQFLFPASKRSLDPRSGKERRHHLDSSALQRAVRQAARRAGLQKRVTCHTLRH